MPDTLDPALEAALPGTPNDVADTLRARADFERWAKDEYPNSNPPSAAWVGWHGARKFYLAAASPQAEIDRLREALKGCVEAIDSAEPDQGWGSFVGFRLDRAKEVLRALHPETPKRIDELTREFHQLASYIATPNQADGAGE